MTEPGSIKLALSQRGQQLHVEPSALDVWGVPLSLPESCVSACADMLSENERVSAGRFIRSQDRRRYIVAHAMLRVLLAGYTGVDIHAVSFVTGAQGKPSLAP